MNTDVMLARLKRLPVRLRIAHLAALLRCEACNSPRASALRHLLSGQSAALAASVDGGCAG